MNKILVLVENEYISFSKYNRDINPSNLNNTNVINVKNLKFTEDYILENLELIYTFLNLIFLKFKIDKVLIKNLEIAETVIKLINNISGIKYISFSEDKELNYTISSLLLKNKTVEEIECYNLPDIMFYKFRKNQIKTRNTILATSNFMKTNGIKTYSDLFNKDKIVIDEYLDVQDIDDIIYFFSVNKNLKRIELKRYSKQNLQTILKFLEDNNLKKIKVIIHESSLTTDDLLKDIKLFDRLNKKFNVNIKIKYSKEYKEKNKIKELNLIMLKYIILTCVALGILLLVFSKLLELKGNNNIDENMQTINDTIDNTINQNETNNTEEEAGEQYISSYYQNYSKVYEELLKLNNETVGWITVNNTKINYPVVQAKDNDYYLNYAYDRTKNIAGWLFVDYRNDMNNISQNTIIYGHSGLESGVMFSTLEKVINKSWYSNKDNLNISFSIKGKEYKWIIFSIYTIKETSDYLYTDFSDDEEYLQFIKKIKNRSINDFKVEVNSNDKILTLSTCYKDDKSRVVIHAKMN